ncbi:ABC transporter permease [Athalassotoga sp.]|uniref:ABC transporter permease n=1 Tax=Athalassotoga sp. TaxID=2022597 RepID=UPI003D080611
MTIFLRDLLIRTKSLTMLLSMILMPLSYLIFLSLSLNNMLSKINFAGISITYLEYVFPGILIIGALQISMLCGSLLNIEKRSGMLETILSSPISRIAFIFGRLINSYILSFAELFLILFLVKIISPDISLSLGFILLGLLTIFLFSTIFSNISLILASTLKSEENYTASISITIVVVTFISNVFYPLSSLPMILQKIAMINPVSLAANSLRYTMTKNYQTILQNILILLIISLAFSIFNYKVFLKAQK